MAYIVGNEFACLIDGFDGKTWILAVDIDVSGPFNERTGNREREILGFCDADKRAFDFLDHQHRIEIGVVVDDEQTFFLGNLLESVFLDVNTEKLDDPRIRVLYDPVVELRKTIFPFLVDEKPPDKKDDDPEQKKNNPDRKGEKKRNKEKIPSRMNADKIGEISR